MPTRPNERWPTGFMSDQLASGRRFRIPAVAAGFPRPRVGQLVATSITGARLALFPAGLGKAAATPKAVVCDNGPELTSKAMRFWSERSGAALNFIQPGKPTQNAFVEGFNGKFRDSCLNRHWFRGLADVRRIVDDWRRHYNHERPHSSLGYSTPAERAKQAVSFYSLSKWTCFRGRVTTGTAGEAPVAPEDRPVQGAKHACERVVATRRGCPRTRVWVSSHAIILGPAPQSMRVGLTHGPVRGPGHRAPPPSTTRMSGQYPYPQ